MDILRLIIMALITTADKNKLYLHIKHVLGYPLRPFEITDEMMDSYLEMVIEDYSSLVNNWLIQQQWIGLEGLSKENSDFLSAFTGWFFRKAIDLLMISTSTGSLGRNLSMRSPVMS